MMCLIGIDVLFRYSLYPVEDEKVDISKKLLFDGKLPERIAL